MIVGRWLGITYQLKGLQNFRDEGGIVVLNHQSFLDIIVLGYIWLHLGPTAVIVKKEVMYLPPIGLSMWSYGSILIDRSNKGAALRSIEKASRAIKGEGKKLVFFPEGTRSVADTLRPFKNGAFATAMENKCKVFPVVVSKFKHFDHKRKVCIPSEGLIRVLDPIDAAQFKDMKELRDHCQVVMQKGYEEVNAELAETEKEKDN